MSIAQRVRDQRYARGWGPDELASRAEISRTALYQIECGKTEVPRAATLNRIARALGIPIEHLMGNDAGRDEVALVGAWEPAAVPAAIDLVAAFENPSARTVLHQKLDELLSSPLGDGMARILTETHRLLVGQPGAARARA